MGKVKDKIPFSCIGCGDFDYGDPDKEYLCRECRPLEEEKEVIKWIPDWTDL